MSGADTPKTGVPPGNQLEAINNKDDDGSEIVSDGNSPTDYFPKDPLRDTSPAQYSNADEHEDDEDDDKEHRDERNTGQGDDELEGPVKHDCPITQLVILQRYHRQEETPVPPMDEQEHQLGEEEEEADKDRPDYEFLAKRTHLYKHLSGATVFSMYSVHNEEEDLDEADEEFGGGYLELEAEYDVAESTGSTSGSSSKLEYRILTKVIGGPSAPRASSPDDLARTSTVAEVAAAAATPPAAAAAAITVFSSISAIVDVIKSILVMDSCQGENITTKVVIVDDELIAPALALAKPVMVTVPLAQRFASMVNLRIARASYVSRVDFDLDNLLSSKYLPSSTSGTLTIMEKVEDEEAEEGEGGSSERDRVEERSSVHNKEDIVLEQLHGEQQKPSARRRVKTHGVQFASVLPSSAGSTNAPPHPPTTVVAHHALLGKKFANRRPIADDGSDFYGEEYAAAMHARFAVHHSSVGPPQTRFPYLNAGSRQVWRSRVIASPAQAEVLHASQLHHHQPRQKDVLRLKETEEDAASSSLVTAPPAVPSIEDKKIGVRADASSALVTYGDGPTDAESLPPANAEGRHQQSKTKVGQRDVGGDNASGASGSRLSMTFPQPPLDAVTLKHVKQLLPTVKPVAIKSTHDSSSNLTVVLEPRPPPRELTQEQQLEKLSWSRRFCPFYGPDKRFGEEQSAPLAYDVKLYSEYDRPSLAHKVHAPPGAAGASAKVLNGLFPRRPGVLESIILSHNTNIHAIESIVQGTLESHGDSKLLPDEFETGLHKVRQQLDDMDHQFYREGYTRKNAMHAATLREVQKRVLNHPYREPTQDEVMMLALALQRKKDAEANVDLKAASTMQRRDTNAVRQSMTRAYSIARIGSLVGRSRSFASSENQSQTPSHSAATIVPSPASWTAVERKSIAGFERRNTLSGVGTLAVSIIDRPCFDDSASPAASVMMSKRFSFQSEGSSSVESPRTGNFDPAMPSFGFMCRDHSITPATRLALHRLELQRMRDQFQTEQFTRTVLSEADIGVTQAQTADDYNRAQFLMEQFIQREEAEQKQRLLTALQEKSLPQLTFSRVPKKS